MKRKLFFTCMIPAMILCQDISAQERSLSQLWEAKEQLPTPESVLYRADLKQLYVSLIDGDASAKDGKGGIAILHADGTVKDAQWITGLHAPKGMALYKDLLYIADIATVVVVDVVTGNVINEIAVPDATFLNDVTVDDNGVVYVSDTRENKIFELRANKPSLYMDNVKSVNGLLFDKGHLYALAGPELWKIDANKKVTVIAQGFEKGGDGLEPVGNGDFLVTCWPGIIYYVKADGKFTKLQDVQGKMNTADLGYNSKDRILYIPTFNNNSVVAYQLK